MPAIYFLDTTVRSMRLIACSVTRTAANRLVLRAGSEVGRLDELFPTADNMPARFYSGFGGPAGTLPVLLVPEQGYKAQSSAGFVNVLGAACGVEVAATCGLQLFGRDKPESLRLLREPVPCFALADAAIRRLRTHNNSNQETATAAYFGLQVRSQLVPNEIIVSEGQSDWTNAWAIRTSAWSHAEWLDSLPAEFAPRIYEEFSAVEYPATVVEFDRY